MPVGNSSCLISQACYTERDLGSSKPVNSLGITGGIACGKSTAAHLLARSLGAKLFSADQVVRELWKTDEGLLDLTAKKYPDLIHAESGEADLSALRVKVFTDPTARAFFDSYLHPIVVSKCREQMHASTAPFVAEIPLLFEIGVQQDFAFTLAVCSSPSTQRERLEALRSLSPEEIDGVLVSQWEI